MYGHKVGKSAMSYGHKVNVSANSYGHKVARRSGRASCRERV